MTNKQIDNIGVRIRTEYPKISDEGYFDLQTIRTSYQSSVSNTFNELCDIVKKVNSLSIISYRLKRLESIIVKLQRYPKMKLNRMWDIGGCRCIVKSTKHVYKLRDHIRQKFTVRKEYDYIEKPQEEGYQSLHMFLESNNNKVIEVQIRTQQQHNWATLVEISDLLFDAGIKEFGRNRDLLLFHKLLSSKHSLSIDDKMILAKILKKYDYYNKLIEVFLRNSPQVRRQWIDIEKTPNKKYFILKTSKEEVPEILAYETFEQAEVQYFQMFLTNKSSNIVLTHLPKPNFNQISTAYSNYILTFHAFIKEWLSIYEELILQSIINNNVPDFKQNYQEYVEMTFKQISALIEEINKINELY
ncbi:MAG: hypothetical protein ACI9P5_002015 [Saprospiraceae bacterium]|jgi:hypothetical protein